MQIKRAVIEVFGGCNYSCKMCPQTTGREKSFLRKMPFNQFEHILDQLSAYGKPVINLEGSGEATLTQDLPKYIRACRSRGFPTFMFTNGSRLTGPFMREIIDAGISFIRFSIIGSDPQEYKQWMGVDAFDEIKNHIKETHAYIRESNASTVLSSYHLITNSNQLDKYKILVDELQTIGYVWKMHNWSGNYTNSSRKLTQRKSCGRPFAPEITIRAGGINGQTAAVTPCCQTMGPPNESKSVLGHLSNQSLEEIWHSKPYQNLRDAHQRKDFDSISYCKGCDFLYDDPSVLVWTNDVNHKQHKMLGTTVDLDQFR